MILDVLGNCAAYAALHQSFAQAFEFLRATDLGALPAGRHAVDGDQMFLSIDRVVGRGRDGARLEAHRRYIDIQLTLEGVEEIGWMTRSECSKAAAFDPERDIGLFDDRPQTWLVVPPGHFCIFFPEDAHAPLAGRGRVDKAILKIAAVPAAR